MYVYMERMASENLNLTTTMQDDAFRSVIDEVQLQHDQLTTVFKYVGMMSVLKWLCVKHVCACEKQKQERRDVLSVCINIHTKYQRVHDVFVCF